MSTIKADALQGKTSAGDIDVTSEGGAATMQLQQGLAKVWGHLNGTGTIAIRDSFSVSSATDHGTGDYSFAFENNMSNSDWVGNLMDIRNRATTPGINFDNTTGTGSCRWSVYDTAAQDRDHTGVAIHGDLA